jgi:hypothetical protein
MCERQLLDLINCENAIEMLFVGDKYHTKHLKSCVIAFVNANRRKVSEVADANRKGVKRMLNENSDVFYDLLFNSNIE